MCVSTFCRLGWLNNFHLAITLDKLDTQITSNEFVVNNYPATTCYMNVSWLDSCFQSLLLMILSFGRMFKWLLEVKSSPWSHVLVWGSLKTSFLDSQQLVEGRESDVHWMCLPKSSVNHLLWHYNGVWLTFFPWKLLERAFWPLIIF